MVLFLNKVNPTHPKYHEKHLKIEIEIGDRTEEVRAYGILEIAVTHNGHMWSGRKDRR